MNGTIRVLVVDDSAYNRRTIARILEEIPGVKVIGYAFDGEDGLRKVIDLKPDLVTLDLAMPRIDGFAFLRIVMQSCPVPVIVVSARTDDQDVFKALELGAVEFVAKPSSRISPELMTIREDLEKKVKGLARTDMAKVVRRSTASSASPKAAQVQSSVQAKPVAGKVQHVVIGSSTGGPPALQTILSEIRDVVPVSFAISQHMPANFTRAFAERLNRFCALEIREAQEGDLMLPGQVLVAPGGKNLTFRRRGSDIVAQLSSPVDGQRYTPSVNAMFESASEVFGSQLLGVVLTGMGNDGAKGIVSIKDRGGSVIAESEESSVVYGMPKEAIATGSVDEVLPLAGMSGAILRRCGF